MFLKYTDFSKGDWALPASANERRGLPQILLKDYTRSRLQENKGLNQIQTRTDPGQTVVYDLSCRQSGCAKNGEASRAFTILSIITLAVVEILCTVDRARLH